RVLAGPDKVRGARTSSEAAGAMAVGWRRGRAGEEVQEIPLADGGEGTLDALVTALGGRIEPQTVTGPLGDPVDAAFGLVDDGHTEVVEVARASGLVLRP